MIRLGIVDDHPVVREGTAALLREQPHIEVVAVAGDPDPSLRASLEQLWVAAIGPSPRELLATNDEAGNGSRE